jgi:subtilisin family serine protease
MIYRFLILTAFVMIQPMVRSQEPEIAVQSPDDIVVAVIDSGVDESSTRLRNFLWTNPFDYSSGFNTIEQSHRVEDKNGHGTHIAGIISGALTKVGSNKIKIMAIKLLNGNHKDFDGEADRLKKALRFAIDHKAKIINMSMAGYEFYQEERDLLAEAGRKGILVVASAGNENLNVDATENKTYPASYGLLNIISVGSIDEDGEKSDFSNYGMSVDISAPGEDVVSVLPNDKLGSLQGTSQSAAYVTRVAANLLLQDKSLSAIELKSIIMSSAKENSKLKKFTASGREISESSAKKLLSLYLPMREKMKQARSPASVRTDNE